MKKLILVLAACSALSAQAECYSEGVRVGVVQKFSNKGLINKSWEGELVMEGIKLKAGSDGGTRGGNVWKFSTDKADVAKEIDEAVMTGQAVALKYCEITPLDFTRRAKFETPYIVERAVVRK